jgi:hypothetical protein
MVTVIDRVEFVEVQQFGQFARIDAVILVPVFQQAFLRGSLTITRVT